MTGQSKRFTTAIGAVGALLDMVHQISGLRTSFLAQTTPQRFLTIKVQDYGGCRLIEGRDLPLQESYCSYVAKSGEMLMVEDTQQDERFSNLAVTQEANIGSYMGAPVYLADGTLYGTLCAIDPNPHTFSTAQAEQLQTLAALVGFIIGTEQGTFFRAGA
jgi:GAF domain-containing protein